MIATSDIGSPYYLLALNKYCVENNIDFLPVYQQDTRGYVGPLVIPGETACFSCLRKRQMEFTSDAVRDDAEDGYETEAAHPSMLGVLSEIALFELHRYYDGVEPLTPGHLIEIDLASGSTRKRKVLKMPRCSVCSPMNSSSAVDIQKLETEV